MSAATGPLLIEGVDALKRGDLPVAESKLRAEIQAHPDDVEALSFLGVALDNEKKFAEADSFHRRALALAPRSNSILDKYASHQLAAGDEAAARKTFLKALALDAADGYANLQLAQMALKDKDGSGALSYLNRLSAEQAAKPDVVLLRVQALELSGSNTEAETLLEGALRQQPHNADVLYNLAYLSDAEQKPVDAFHYLAQAAQAAPGRSDIQKSLATAAGNLGEFKASADAWNAYMKLEPADDTARRERGFMNAHMGQLDSAIADLRWYTARHPADADGWYELGIAESAKDPTTGMSSLDKSIALKPDFAAARSVRGALYYREGKPEKALPDLEFAAAAQPRSAMIQYRLGQDYLALDRLSDAIAYFRRATELAPDDYPAEFHLANALAQAGQTAESDKILERIKNWPVKQDTSSTDLPDR